MQTPAAAPIFVVHSPTAFAVNGWLVDLILIQHWGQEQGGAKFHGIKTSLSILKHFIEKLQIASKQPPDEGQIKRTMTALRRLADYGYYIPPEVFHSASQKKDD